MSSGNSNANGAAVRRAQVRASILVTKKVLFLGRWHTNDINDDIVQHLRRNLALVPSQKAKLKISELGLFFGKRVIFGRTQDEFVPMDRVVQVFVDCVHTSVLLSLIKGGVKSVYDILVFRCVSESDARQAAEVFRRVRALYAASSATCALGGQHSTMQRGQLLPAPIVQSNGGRLIDRNRTVRSQGEDEAMMLVEDRAGTTPPPMAESNGIDGAESPMSPIPDHHHHHHNGNARHSSRHHQHHHHSNTMPHICGETDAAFKRRMRREFSIKRGEYESDEEGAAVIPTSLVAATNGGATVDVVDTTDACSVSDSIAAQQRALNEKVSFIAEEVGRLRSVFESTLRTAGSQHHLTSANVNANCNGQYTLHCSNNNNRIRSSSESERNDGGGGDGRSPMNGNGVDASRTSSRSSGINHAGKQQQQQPTRRAGQDSSVNPNVRVAVQAANNQRGRSASNSRQTMGVMQRQSQQQRRGGPSYATTTYRKQNGTVDQMSRSKSSQWISGTSGQQYISTDDLGAPSEPEDERIRRQREIAERIRQERRENLHGEPFFVVREGPSHCHQHPGGYTNGGIPAPILYKARSVPNFLVTSTNRAAMAKCQVQQRQRSTVAQPVYNRPQAPVPPRSSPPRGTTGTNSQWSTGRGRVGNRVI